MKKWPKNDQTVNFEDLTGPVAKAIRFAFKLKRQNINKSIPWSGYDLGEKEKGVSLSPDESLTAENLRYVEDNQRDALEVLVGLAVQLGIEQGRRLEKNNKLLEKNILEAQTFLFEYLRGLVKKGEIKRAQDFIRALES